MMVTLAFRNLSVVSVWLVEHLTDILDEIWKHRKRAKEMLAKYSEQNRLILEQERMLEARMKKSRLSKTILDVDDGENETEEQGNSERQLHPAKMTDHQTFMPHFRLNFLKIPDIAPASKAVVALQANSTRNDRELNECRLYHNALGGLGWWTSSPSA